jgi:hypothetical protein
MNNKIIELAYLRNQLASENFRETDKQLLHKIKQEITELNTPFKNIAVNAINNCEENIKNSNFKLALQEIQLIHNFPFTNPKTWNSDYFYKIELLSYLEKTEDVQRIKRLILLLSELQNTFELP